MSGQPKAGYVGTVGALRAHIAGLPDDARVMAQVRANDGQVWNVGMDFGPVIGAKPPALGISASHPRLRALVEGDAPSMCAACLAHKHHDCAGYPKHNCGCPECARAFGQTPAGPAPADPIGYPGHGLPPSPGGPPACLGCGGETRHYGDFVNREYECPACGEFTLRIRRAGAANPADVLERAAEERAAAEGREVDRESFDAARAHLDEPVPAGFEPPDPDRVRPEVLEMGRKVMDAHAETMWRLAVSEREDLTVGKALAWAREADEHTSHAYELEESLSEALGRPLCRTRCGRPGCRPCNLVAAGNAARAKGEGEDV